MMSMKPRFMEFEDTWQRVKDTAKCVLMNKYVSQATWSDCFWDVYNLCTAWPEPFNERLYSELKTLIRHHVMQQLHEILEENQEQLLRSYCERWKAFSSGMKYLNYLFSFLNHHYIYEMKLGLTLRYARNYTSDSPELLEIGDLGLEEWKQHLIKPLQTTLTSQILQCVSLDREGKRNASNLTFVQEVIQSSFVTVSGQNWKSVLDLYKEMVEEPVLKASAVHYKTLAANWLQGNDVSGYAKRVLALMEEEKERANRFFHSSTYGSLKKVLEEHMILDHLSIIIDEIKPVIWNEKKTDMARMFKILQSIPQAMEHFAGEFTKHVRAEGVAKMQGIPSESLHIYFVDTILDVYRKYKDLIEKSLKDEVFIAALDRACSGITNFKAKDKVPTMAPELLSRYCDQLLKKSAKALTDSELEEKLNDCVVVFRYIDDKDIFQKFYSRMLAKRLIHQNSYSMDAEEWMINRLKQVCGNDYTNKLHCMFTDVKVSEDLNAKFRTQYLPSQKIELGLGFSVYVLQAGSWPLGQSPNPSLILPKEVDNTLKVFENFYSTRHTGRKLMWMYNLCHADLKVSFTSKPYIFTMQAHQMAIMMLFENVDALTCIEIRTTLNIDKEYFERCLSTLLESKLVLLDTQTIEDSSTLFLNRDYTNKRMKLRITPVLQKETQQEITQTVASAEADRKIYLQACIVRIMKARKSIKRNDLIREMMSMCLMFTPSIHAIEQSIEALIKKMYIARSPNAVDEYIYMA